MKQPMIRTIFPSELRAITKSLDFIGCYAPLTEKCCGILSQLCGILRQSSWGIMRADAHRVVVRRVRQSRLATRRAACWCGLVRDSLRYCSNFAGRAGLEEVSKQYA